MEDNGGIAQLIVFIVVGVLYGIATILKKVNEWVNRKRMMSPQGGASRESRPPQQETQPPRTARDLLGDLERTLTGQTETEEPGQAPFYAPPPASQAPTLSRRETRTSAAPSFPMAEESEWTRPARSKAARVNRAQVGHLAVLRTAQDLRQGILMREILGPPVSLRGRRPGPASPRPGRRPEATA